MVGRVNRRGWIVLESIASTDGNLCVDFFEDPSGGYGFAHFRTDAEDRGSWTAIGGSEAQRFASMGEAISAAVEAVTWVKAERRSREALEMWQDTFRSDQ